MEGSLNRILDTHKNDSMYCIELLRLKAAVESGLGKLSSDRTTIERMHGLYTSLRGSTAYDEWLDSEVGRLSSLGKWTLAISHLEVANANSTDEELRAWRELQIGDLLVNQGRYESAKQKYVATGDLHDAVWGAAMLRTARLIMFHEDNAAEAEILYAQIVERVPETVEGEEARHILKIFGNRSTPGPAPSDSDPLTKKP